MKFSIVIPSYNRAAFISQAIESVLAQTYTDWELLIVDDGSTDNTSEVVAAYTDQRIRYIYQQNAERSAARNNGVCHASGEYVCFMDSDNVLKPNRLQSLSEFIAMQGQEACYYTDIEYYKPQTKMTSVKCGKTYGFPVDVNILIRDIIATPQICCATSILKKHKFNVNLSIGEDLELLFRITAEYPLVYIPGQSTVVEIEHDGRSVASRSRASERQFTAMRVMFSDGHPASRVSGANKRWLRSAVLYNASVDYLCCGDCKGVKYLVKSILAKPFQKVTVYRLNLLFSYFFRRDKMKMMLGYE